MHILLILIPEDKLRSADDYDKIVSAKILDLTIYPLTYEIVATTIMHSLCNILNPSASCMKDGMCQKRYSKSFQENT